MEYENCLATFTPQLPRLREVAAVTNCPAEVGHRSTTATLLAKLALERKRHLGWGAKAERVTNDDGTNKLLMYAYRKPWPLG